MLKNILPLTGDNIYSEVQKNIVKLVQISSLMANDTFLKDWVLDGERDTSQVTKYLKNIKSQYHTIICFFASDKTRAYYYPDGVWTIVEKDNPRDAWYFKAKNIQEEYQINLGMNDIEDGAFTIFVNYKVVDYDNRFIGVTGCGLTVDNVQKQLDVYAKKYNRVIYFVNRKGRVVLASSISPPPFTTLDDVKQLKAKISLRPDDFTSHALSYSRDNETCLLNTRYIPELKLYLFVEQSLKSANRQQLTRLLIKNFLITFIIGSGIIAAVFLTIQKYQKDLEILATTDKLTRLNNRHSFEILLTQALKQADRENHPLTMILFDIDFFKKVNDNHGHPAGDAVLQQVAATALNTLRKTDVICRWGGEEFLIILPNCAIEAGKAIAEQLRQAVNKTIFRHGDLSLSVTISLGITQWQPGEREKDLIKRVDTAVYKAKENGRNRVETA